MLDWKDLIQFIWTPFIAWWIWDKKQKDTSLKSLNDKVIRLEAEKASKDEVRELIREEMADVKENSHYTRQKIDQMFSDSSDLKSEIASLRSVLEERLHK